MSRTPRRIPAHRRQVLRGQAVTVRCDSCRVRVGLLHPLTGVQGAGWDGKVFSRGEDAGFPPIRRYWCQRCGAPWPGDEAVARLVAWAKRTGMTEVVLRQAVPEEPGPSRRW